MAIYVLKRLAGLLPVGFAVVTAVALLIHMVPGDPVDAILGDFATLADKTALRQQLGLDQPLWRQLWNYYLQLLHGDLGTSLIHHTPVAELIGARFQATFELAVAALAVALAISLPLGVVSALYKGRWPDGIASAFALMGIGVPTFWMGPMLVLIFSLELGWLPVSERGGWASYILPALTMGIALASILSRMTRNAMLDCLREDYVRTAQAKGLSARRVVLKHALRNAALPIVTVVGLQFGVLLTGAIITERVFDWPGLGTLILEGLASRDYPVVQGCVLFFSFSYLCVNLLTDLAYALVDPRIALRGRAS